MPAPERTSLDPQNIQDNHEHLARPILSWLARPAADEPADDIETLRGLLDNLRCGPFGPAQRQKLVGLLHPRANSLIDSLLPRLYSARLPISPRTRQLVRNLQDCLEHLAALYLDETRDGSGRLIKGLQRPLDLSLWRSLDASARRILLADLVGAPHPQGCWETLHTAFGTACQLGMRHATPGDSPCSIENLYFRALLLGCAPPSTFTALEWSLIARVGTVLGHLLTLAPDTTADAPLFWLDPRLDTAPLAQNRRPIPERTGLLFLRVRSLCETLETDIPRLRHGVRPDHGAVPDGFPARHAAGVLQRLLGHLRQTRKRRFPRRRQSYRTRACFGFDAVWPLFRQVTDIGDADHGQWQITNESPDGYAAMHVAGPAHKVQIGDAAALRATPDAPWQLCIVRWVLSENPEHLELGLQIMAPTAVPAMLAYPGQEKITKQPVLLLPPVPPLRLQSAIAMPGGLHLDGSDRLVLIIERGNVEVREVRLVDNLEHATGLDVYLIEDVVSAA